jgi:nitrile hydratase accessory protein
MITRFEHFAVADLMGGGERPPRLNGTLCFAASWERAAFGMALALAKNGVFEWESFHQNLIAAIARWERSHALDDPSWNYYDCWLEALEQTLVAAGSVSSAEWNERLTTEAADTAQP